MPPACCLKKRIFCIMVLPIRAMINIGTPAPSEKKSRVINPSKLLFSRITSTKTAAKMGPAQGVQIKPIKAPIPKPETKPP